MIALLRGIRLWLLLCVLAVVALGCGGESEEMPVADTEAPVAIEEPSVPEFESPLTGGTALPEGMPDDVPSYPGAEVREVGESPEGGLLVSYGTADTPEEVSTHLLKAFSDQGWSTKGTDAGLEGNVLSADKEGRSATLFITVQEGETRVDLFLMPSE